jgi:hypothetical protein
MGGAITGARMAITTKKSTRENPMMADGSLKNLFIILLNS